MAFRRYGFTHRDFGLNACGRHHLVQGLHKPNVAKESSLEAQSASVWVGVTNGQRLHRDVVLNGRFKQVAMKYLDLMTFAAGAFWKSSHAIAVMQCNGEFVHHAACRGG